MKKSLKSILALTLALVMVVGLVACSSNSSSTPAPAADGGNAPAGDGDTPSGLIHVSMYYADNPTLPWKDDWLAAVKTAEICGLDLEVEAIPSGEMGTKVSLALNTQENCPDVILYQSTSGENAALALNGAIVPISDLSEKGWTPNFDARVAEFDMEADIDLLRLSDGKLYYMPALTDVPFFDGGLIMREDWLESHNIDAPKTFDDLYEILKAYKAENPDSYPLTHLVAPYVTYRMTMPSFGASFGKSSSASRALSYDYDKNEYFMGAISDQAREYLKYMRKLFDEGLLDPEGSGGNIETDTWTTKMATGAAMATYAYYDQIGSVTAASDIDGFKLQMYPSLEGPAGAHHQPKSRTGAGIMFPTATTKRDDFEQIVRAIDQMFYSEECAKIWCLGVEGVTYNMVDGKVVYTDEIANSADGIYKYMQVKYGCGADPVQQVWVLEQELTKYDENYAEIQAAVAEMENGTVIRPVPPVPAFDDLTAEDANSLQTPLGDAIEKWIDAFVYGTDGKDPNSDADWEEYTAELKNLGIEEFCQMYNDNLRK